jgi:hypothetical protein
MMTNELSALFACVNEPATKADYRREIVDSNVLGKPTKSARLLTFGHLADLYGLSPELALFRGFRRLWDLDELARPVLALTLAAARDPLLCRSTDFILSRLPGEVVFRVELERFLVRDEPARFSPSSLTSLAKNISSTWTQAGFLEGRARKTRSTPRITPVNVAFALFLGYLEGLSGQRLFSSNWMKLLSVSLNELEQLAESASRRGFIIFMNAGGVQEVRFPGYLTFEEELLRQESRNV